MTPETTSEPYSVPSLPEEWTTLDAQSILQHLAQMQAMTTTDYQLDPRPTFTNVPIHIYDTVTSTNTILWQHIHAAAEKNGKEWQDGTVAIARQQSAGKGQWGRQWQSSLGGLYLSMALKPHCPVTAAAQMTLSVVVGVAMALRACFLPVLIKWPNDLVVPSSGLGGAATSRHPISGPPTSGHPTSGPSTSEHQSQVLYKLGGILTETRLQGQTIHQAVVGIGLNGANPVPPQGITIQSLWTTLQQQQTVVEPSPLGPSLISLNGIGAIAIWGILTGWQRWQQNGIMPILADYNHLLSHRGQFVSVQHQDQVVQGHILGVNASGQLRLRPSTRPSSVRVNTAIAPGTLSPLQSSSQEILLTPGGIRLGYRLHSQYQGNYA